MDNYTIVVDTRERKPLWNKNVIVKKLEVGDYSIDGYEDRVAIERKSLTDLFGTLGKGHKRFKKELEKTFNYEYFCIVIEGSISQVLNKDFDGAYFSKMKGYVILKILFTIHLKYGIPVFFCKDRVECKYLIKFLLNTYKTKHLNTPQGI